MAGGTTDNPGSPAPSGRAPRFPFSRKQIVVAAAALFAVIMVVVLVVRVRAGGERRQYDAAMRATLDKLLTAQEGFFYDSSHYVGSLRRLPTVKITQGVHVELVNPNPRIWWGIATHPGVRAHRCVVWVGGAPPSFPAEVRNPENEAKPICFDDVAPAAPSRGS
jgi:hypothetical protein